MPVIDRFGTTTSSGSQPTVTRTVTKSVVPVGQTDLVVDPDVLLTKKHEEWVTNKRVVNHKTKQVETRVQRQLVLEDGRVIADSGPQVTTKTKEDVKVEESENTEHKTTGDDPPGPGYVLVPGSAKVISEKTESNQTVTETREENRQMHDEKIRDLSGEEIHQRTIISPDDPSFGHSLADFPGKLTHYSSRSQKIVDKDEVKEVSELKDGEVTTETTRTHHHEEAYDDEVPEEEAEPGMVPERSAETSRTLQYYTDPREFEEATERLEDESRRSRLLNHGQDGTRAVTYRWVDDHFGGQNGTAPGAVKNENIKTSSGGNRIVIEMSPHRSSPSDFSPRDTLTKSRDSTLKNRSSTPRYVVEMSPSPPYPPSTPVNNTLGRSTASPFEVYSSSGSSRSKTPVKTFYLGEDNTYQREANNSGSSWKTRTNHFLADAHSSTTSIADSNSLGRSNLSGHYGERSDSFCRIPRSRMADYPPTRYETRQNGAVYSKVNRVKTDKNVQVSLSDEEDDPAPSKHRHRSESPAKANGRSSTTMPRIIKVTHETSKSPYSTHSLSNSRHYRSSDSLHSPTGHGGYYEYGTNGHHSSYRNSSSPIYNNSSFHRGTSRNVDDGRRRNDDSYTRHRLHEVKVNKKNSSSHDYSSSNGYGKSSLYTNGRGTSKSTHDLYNGGRGTTNKSTTPTTYYYATSSPKGKKIPTSPPESGYQSPFPPTPPSSPPPRFGKVLTSDHYGSSSSFSPPESPVHPSTASIRRKAAYPSGSASRSKSSSDLRTDPLFAPEAFSPLSSPLKLKTVGEKSKDPQKVYRVKPGQDGQSVVVQVRDWNAR